MLRDGVKMVALYMNKVLEKSESGDQVSICVLMIRLTRPRVDNPM